VLDAESLIPRVCGNVDADRVRAMPLAPTDGFVLSRVDGTSSVGDLAQAMGLHVDEVFASLLKLESLRLVELPKSRKSSKPPRASRPDEEAKTRAPTARTAPGRSPQPVNRISPPPRRPSPPPRAAPRAPAPVAAPAPAAVPFAPLPNLDLSPEHQQQIATIFAQLDVLDHYALLGVARTADKKAIKRSYFELTGKFHPDRFFRKEIGPFKSHMEAIFRRMTEAHDALTDGTRRADYDVYLGSVEKTRGIEQMVAETAAEMRRAEQRSGDSSIPTPPPAPVAAAVPAPPRSAPRVDPPRSEPRASFDRETPAPDPSKASNLVGVGTIHTLQPDERARREALARRLTGNRASSGQPTPQQAPQAMTQGPMMGFAKAEAAVDSLKRRYEDKVATARTGQGRKYMETGLAALEKGDVVSAANALRVALTFDGENPELKAAYDKAQRASDKLLGEQYLKQADYEEKAGKWAEAARSWRRVARAREDDAKAHERAAHCLVKAAGNLHDAAALAQCAAKLAPKDASVRVTLANVYLAAGLTLNARRELETAAQLAPNDATIASLLKRIGKSD
jgi:curved DNA-binding protein CbpA